ncbi:unnamed protein product [Zymoseptoria tritici ST99CH_1E4]|uniref:Thioester reductase (TE) domain-containing protein n=1 Tax=Zymoseptoria tritici ST99CH_1E4 TaxID=1276532 RepID=A0A2H1GTN4_ZYMTR|nr:unnamed protein product [Zymoseptoria tritici ST99CH_1E4]
MKIVLTGSTGFIGSEILKQCIAHTFISHIYVLTRRPLDNRFSHKKVTQLLHEEFETYSPELLDRLREEGVEACIWSLGGSVQQFKDLDEARRVGVNYPVAAAEAFAGHLATALEPHTGFPEKSPGAGEKRFPFRFVFISGWGAEVDQFRRLWMYSDSRKIKGAAEKGLFETVQSAGEVEGHKCFEVIALRPGRVLAGSADNMGTVISEAIMPCISVDRLARTAIKTAFDGGKGQTILENKDCLGEDWAMVNSIT